MTTTLAAGAGPTDFDVVIVGGGSAGAVMAHRLSTDPSRRVLLLEAGPDTPPDAVPEAILDSYPGTAYLNPGFLWNDLRVTNEVTPPGTARQAPLRKYEQARVMGGGSSINGQFFNRGAPGDYDEWAAMGLAGWAWDDVLPYFRMVERDLDFQGPLHGREGRIPVRRIMPPQWPGHAVAFGEGLETLGYRYLPDQNGAFEDGWFPISISNENERRVSSAMAYLDEATRRRPNLTIRAHTEVSRLLFDGTRCVGVEAQHLPSGTAQRITAREVIVCSGALHSPALLLRSGVGGGAELQALGIPVVANLPGVGQHLMEHPAIALASFTRPRARVNHHTRRHILAGWRYSSGIGGAPQGDMFVSCVTKTSWHAVGTRIGTLLAYVNKPYSHTGGVTLTSPDWRTRPKVEFQLLSDERDSERLVDAFRRMSALQMTEAMQSVSDDAFPASYSEKVRQVAMLSRKNKFVTDVLATLLDGPSALRHVLMRKVVAGGPTMRELLSDTAALKHFVRSAAVGVWHPGCTCRMGLAGDPTAVTDSEGRVHGTQNLRVVDASIFPNLPRGNINFPTMMAAERISGRMTA